VTVATPCGPRDTSIDVAIISERERIVRAGSVCRRPTRSTAPAHLFDLTAGRVGNGLHFDDGENTLYLLH
jgi:hypothetical protein